MYSLRDCIFLSGSSMNDNTKRLTRDVIDFVTKNEAAVSSFVDLCFYSYHTFQHSLSVFNISMKIGEMNGFDNGKLFNLGLAALFHDIGKKNIDVSILNKPGKLTLQEREEINRHPQYGYDEAIRLGFSEDVAQGILTHHEKKDGTGYPNRLSEEHIPEIGRIISVADVYDAITSDRPYRQPMPAEEAVSFLMNSNSFDFEAVKNLIRLVKSEENEKFL